MEEELRPLAVPDVHELFFAHFAARVEKKARILDYGAGEGAFAQRLARAGYGLVSACDYNPGLFRLPGVDCLPVGEDGRTPFADGGFDVIVAIEVFEHLYAADAFFAEGARLLAPGGRLFLTTPNILSLKSRWRFFFTGHAYSFPPLEAGGKPGMQHVNAMTVDQIRHFAQRRGLALVEVGVDKRQRSARLLSPLGLFIPKTVGPDRLSNRADLRYGRKLFVTCAKDAPPALRPV